MIHLYDHQVKIIDEIRSLMKAGNKSILTVAPCGSGKTILAAFMIKTAADKKINSLFLCHRRELLHQTISAFGKVGVPHGVIANGFMEDRKHHIQIGSVQTISRRLKTIKTPQLVVIDEAHHIAAKSWASIYNQFPNAFFVGLTATPQRTDQTGLGKWFKKMVLGPTTNWLIQNNFLSKYKLYAPPSVNTSGIHTRMGDFEKAELSKLMEKPSITGNAVLHYKKLVPGKRAIVRGVSIEHSKFIADQFTASGVPARHVDGDTSKEDRDNALKDFKTGRILILSNVDLYGEGLDINSVECVIDLRPTKSLILWIQFCGRALRTCEGKNHAIILDHAGNTERHGLPDEDREWSLEGFDKKNKTQESKVKVKICPKCYAAQIPGLTACKFCGFVFEVKSREVELRDGELVEIDPDIYRQHRLSEQGKCKTLEELIALGKKRKYKFAYRWAHHIFRIRQARKIAGVK